MKNLHELFLNELSLMLDAEKQIIKALPNVIKAASSKELKDALRHHLKETKGQVRRLELIFKQLDRRPLRVHSKAMKHLLAEAGRVIQARYTAHVKDAALINCAQHVEHFEIASYGALKSLAKSFEYYRIYDLLEDTAKEEGNANKKLTEIAEGTTFTKGINLKALKQAA